MSRQPIVVVFGLHAVEQVLVSEPERVLELMVAAGRQGARTDALVRRAKQSGISVQPIGRDAFTRLVGSARHQGVIARVRAAVGLDMSGLETLLDSLVQDPLLLVLDQALCD